MQDYWEFPGGKLADGESAEAALSRELREELGIEVLEASYFGHIDHTYPELSVSIDFYRVLRWQGDPRGLEGQALRWVNRETLHEQRLLPADAPVIEALIEM